MLTVVTLTRVAAPRLCALGQPLVPAVRQIYSCASAVRFNKKKEVIQSKIPAFEEDKPFSPRKQLKLLVRDYGATGMVVHISISLFSLGCCYAIVRLGVPVGSIIRYSPAFTETGAKYLESGGTFALAYLIHKSLVAFRFAATALTTPFLVRTLRSRGILKPAPDKTATKE